MKRLVFRHFLNSFHLLYLYAFFSYNSRPTDLQVMLFFHLISNNILAFSSQGDYYFFFKHCFVPRLTKKTLLNHYFVGML